MSPVATFVENLDLQWPDLIDLLLLSLIFYRLLILIKGPRTISMLLGFSLLLGLYVLSFALQLEATLLLLDNLANSLVLVVVVLFQADIRNALAQFGLFTMFRDHGSKQQTIVDTVLPSVSPKKAMPWFWWSPKNAVKSASAAGAASSAIKAGNSVRLFSIYSPESSPNFLDRKNL